MIEINFYSGVTHPLNAAAKLVAKAYASGKRVRVVTPDEATTQSLDRLLWEVPSESFIPHTVFTATHAAVTPIIIDHSTTHEGAAEVLINLSLQSPTFFARFERLFELVGKDDAQTAAGRERWAFYKARGYQMTHTVLGK
jgi:DNA polymerase III subunit chi